MICDNIFALRNRIFKVTSKRFFCKRRFSFGYPPDRKPLDESSRFEHVIMRPALQHSHMLLQILGCGAPGSSQSLFVSTSSVSYIFNCGEGMQRSAFEYHYKVVKSNNVFITTPVWSNIGGLPGFILTAEKAGQVELNIYGPEGTGDLMKAIKNFVTFKTMTVKDPSLKKTEMDNFEYVDKNMRVECVPLARKQDPLNAKEMLNSDPVLDDINYYDYRNENNKRPSPSINTNNKMRKLQIDLKKGRIDSSMAYICKLKDKPGALNFAKCVELGITPGPVLGRLKAGESVTLPNGKVVTSKDVCSDPSPGPVFIVVDCYDEAVLDSLLKNKSFDKHFISNNPKSDLIPYCIVHFTPEHMLQNQKYKDWMAKFGEDTKHVIINESNNCIGSTAVNVLQRELNLIHPDIFPILADEKYDLPREFDKGYCPKEDGLIMYRAKNNDRIFLRPLNGYERHHITESDLDSKVQELANIDGMPEHLEEFQKTLQDKIESMGPMQEYPKIVVLGTGSSIPCKTRNTAGLLLQISENTSMILDCGEATILQMFKFFGNDECYRILSTLKGIYVSHLHADHHLGLIGILNQRRKVNSDPVYLFAPEQINGWLHFYNAKFEEILSQIELIANKDFLMHKHAIPLDRKNKIFNHLQLSDIDTTLVKHCADSFGVALTMANNKKIVYSGDTQPCDNLVMLGRGCDLLIHEATHEDDMESEAKMKRHSTLSQAITAGHRMEAKHIILTHFSQRYAKIPRVIENEIDISNVGFAYDMMQVQFSQLPLLPMFYSTLRVIFNEFYQELEMKAEKKRTKEKMLNAN